MKELLPSSRTLLFYAIVLMLLITIERLMGINSVITIGLSIIISEQQLQNLNK